MTGARANPSLAVRVTASDQERSRWAKAFEIQIPPAPRRVFAIAAGMWFVLAVLRVTMLPPRSLNLAFDGGYLVLAALNLFMSISRRSTLALAPLNDAPLVLDDAGIRIGGGRAQSIPWRDVARVVDVGDAFLIVRRGLRRAAIPIPKRDCADGGRAIWALLQEKLIGTRMLYRPRASDPIVNVARR